MAIRILLIDDNPDQAVITHRVLQRSGGYELDHASSGEEGIEKLQKWNPNLVLCDYRLPGMSGVDVLKAMRKQGAETPFVIVTSAGSERVAVEAMQEGAYDYLVKDAAYDDLLPRIIQRSLDRFNERNERNRLEAERRQAQQALEKAYAELRVMQEQLIQSAKLESIGRLAAGAAHEVKNPLAVIQMGLEYLAKHLKPDEENTLLIVTSMREAVRRADSVIRGLLDFSAHRLLEPKLQSINPIVEQSIALVKHELDKTQIQVTAELDPALPSILLDAARLEQVFINLLMNAIHAMHGGGKLVIRTRQQSTQQTDALFPGRFKSGLPVLVAEIDDTGEGIPEKVISKIFDPFFTTKPTGQGTGLGLSVTRTIVELHQGAIDIRNRPEGGVRASLVFPLP